MASARLPALTLAAMMMAAGGSPADAACPQALAVYDEAQTGAEIAFAGPLPDVDGMQHRFSLSFAEGGVTMDGVVMMAGEPDRPWGVIMHDCPQGDATGAEIAACTVWEGPVYIIGVEGAVDWLPAREAMRTAGDRLLLPDFGAAVMQSQAWQAERITTLPGDVFRLKACQE
ncbi:hypothetical protein [Hoeflea alexandrii]|uniref:Uncharacterized protein n=1 Tax=Hoeflea alexandrii TaxID=288436 RepID=A0ABT1CR65_9HYPH|nr:hypothetical protein [Hoeflea alexandrii]MCO6408643.1 hypothetical protein [Hoeflea alexandrii]MCY0151324.1 hypothetical protein [Hoeflea alexandrii]